VKGNQRNLIRKIELGNPGIRRRESIKLKIKITVITIILLKVLKEAMNLISIVMVIKLHLG